MTLAVVSAFPASAAAGDLDPSFDSDGKVTTDFSSVNDQGNGVAIQPDGRIVAAGFSQQGAPTGDDFALARYNPDGTLDTTFSSDGMVTTDFGFTTDQGRGVAIQPDGKIVAAGLSLQSGTAGDFALARYNLDGTLDTTFSSDGKVTTDIGLSSLDSANGVAIQSDGRIVAAGASFQGAPTGGDFALARYNPDGTLDTTFSSDGKVTTDFGSPEDQANGVAIQPNGRIVAAGYSQQGAPTGQDFALARYKPDGTLDPTFGSGGKVTTDFGGPQDRANGVAIQPGRIVAAGGSVQGATAQDFALARSKPAGTLDTTFSSDGKVTTDFDLSGDQANGVAIQPDGRIVAAGLSLQTTPIDIDFALARYLGR